MDERHEVMLIFYEHGDEMGYFVPSECRFDLWETGRGVRVRVRVRGGVRRRTKVGHIDPVSGTRIELIIVSIEKGEMERSLPIHYDTTASRDE
jgi:hypothetical protein